MSFQQHPVGKPAGCCTMVENVRIRGDATLNISALTAILFVLLPILIIPGVYRLAARITYRRSSYREEEREETPASDRIFTDHEVREPEPKRQCRRGR